MLRRAYASERIQRIDPHTGIRVIQLTTYPTPTAHFLYDWPSITPDNERVVFFIQREARRGAPWDLFRCDTDGLNLFQLTEHGDREELGGYYGAPSAIMTLDGTTIYVVWDHRLCCVDVETGKVEELASLEPLCPKGAFFGRLSLSSSGTRLFVHRGGNEDVQGTVRIDLPNGAVEEIETGGMLFACCHDRPRLVIQRGGIQWDVASSTQKGVRTVINRTELSLWSVDEDGRDARPIGPWNFAHATLIGGTSQIQACGQPPDRCIWVLGEGEEPTKLVQGPYFWHSGSSYNGEWLAADTNWSDQGIQLIHIATRHFRTLCHPGATQNHVEYGHPHPTLSQDGSLVLFRSDRTGVAQMYIAHITDEFRHRVIEGELDRAQPNWM